MKQLIGTVSKVKEGVYEAKILDGWWVAYGKTAEEAKKKVTERYYNEKEKLTQC